MKKIALFIFGLLSGFLLAFTCFVWLAPIYYGPPNAFTRMEVTIYDALPPTLSDIEAVNEDLRQNPKWGTSSNEYDAAVIPSSFGYEIIVAKENGLLPVEEKVADKLWKYVLNRLDYHAFKRVEGREPTEEELPLLKLD